MKQNFKRKLISSIIVFLIILWFLSAFEIYNETSLRDDTQESLVSLKYNVKAKKEIVIETENELKALNRDILIEKRLVFILPVLIAGTIIYKEKKFKNMQ